MNLKTPLLVSRCLLVGVSLVAMTSIVTSPASAATFDVFAQGNSSTGGSGLPTVSLTLGEIYSVSANPSDIWTAGAIPRWSNAAGLVAPLFATGTDESGAAAGTQIGASFPLYSQGGLTAPYGSLVGRIVGGSYFIIGLFFSGPASASGVLELFFWDENSGDNLDKITATITTASVGETPLPGALPLFATGLGALGLLTWRRKRKAVSA